MQFAQSSLLENELVVLEVLYGLVGGRGRGKVVIQRIMLENKRSSGFQLIVEGGGGGQKL